MHSNLKPFCSESTQIGVLQQVQAGAKLFDITTRQWRPDKHDSRDDPSGQHRRCGIVIDRFDCILFQSSRMHNDEDDPRRTVGNQEVSY